MADQDLDLFAATTDIDDTDLIAIYKKSSDSLFRKMTGANLKNAIGGLTYAASDTGTDVFEYSGRALSTGDVLTVDFDSANTTASPTLENTGAAPSGAQSIVTTVGAAFVDMIEARPHRLQWDGTNFVLLDPAGGVVEKGSGANGEYVRFGDGTLICTHSLQVSFVDTAHMAATWTFPDVFDAVPDAITAMVDLNTFAANATPSLSEVTNTFSAAESATDAQIRVYRVSGGTNFQAGDTTTLRVMAKGTAA